MKLHYLNDSRAQRILWFLEELGLDYEVVTYERNRKTLLAPSRLREVHPLGKAPVLEVEGGLVIAESGAIVEHLAERHARHLQGDEQGAWLPERGSEDFERYRYWMHYAEGSAMTPLLLGLIFSEIVRQSPFIAKPVMRGVEKTMRARMIEPELVKHAAFWEQQLSSSTWFAGEEPTGADIMMSFPLEAFVSRSGMVEGKDDPRYQHIIAFVDRVHARAAYQRALEKGADYAYA